MKNASRTDEGAAPCEPAGQSSAAVSGAITKARGAVLLAAVLWSTSGFFAKSPWFHAWPIDVDGWPVRGPLLAFWRALFALLVLAPFVRRVTWTPRLAPAALLFVVMNVSYLTAMTKTTEANAIWLQNTAPAVVFVIGVFCLGETAKLRDWWMVGFATAGVAIILAGELSRGSVAGGHSAFGLGAGLLSGATYAGVILLLRVMRGTDPAWMMVLNYLVTATLLAPGAAAAWYTQGLFPTPIQFLMLAGFGAIQLGLPYLLFATGLRQISGHEAAGIALVEPLLVPLWVFLAWGRHPAYEPPAWWTFVGGGLILCGLALRFLPARFVRSRCTP